VVRAQPVPDRGQVGGVLGRLRPAQLVPAPTAPGHPECVAGPFGRDLLRRIDEVDHAVLLAVVRTAALTGQSAVGGGEVATPARAPAPAAARRFPPPILPPLGPTPNWGSPSWPRPGAGRPPASPADATSRPRLSRS